MASSESSAVGIGESAVGAYVLDDMQKEIAELKTAVLLMSGKLKDKEDEAKTLRSTVEITEYQVKTLQEQNRKLADREVESRSRANAAEDLVEKFFDKLLSRMN